MINPKTTAISIAVAAAVAAGATGVVNAATTSTTNGNVGSSDIPRTIFKQDRLQAEATVLNTSTATIQAAHKDKSFKQLLGNAKLTPKTFHEKVTANVTTELKAQGYSQDQVTIALQHRHILRMKHHKK